MNQKREINNSYHSQSQLKISQASEVEVTSYRLKKCRPD